MSVVGDNPQMDSFSDRGDVCPGLTAIRARLDLTDPPGGWVPVFVSSEKRVEGVVAAYTTCQGDGG